jgi:DNA-binding transcriptional LysR family regulator
MALNLNLLRLFAAVADERSFSRAAERLRVSQPAVSKGVRALEAQVGARLLERGPRTVRLTEAGAALHAHARTLFAAERAAEEELAAMRGLERGTLRVGASTTIATYLLPKVLAAFHARHEGVELRVTSANTRAITDLLLARELDVALVEGPVHEPQVVAHAWRQDELIVITGRQHALASRRAPVAPSAIASELLIIREPGSGTREIGLDALAGRGIVPRRTLEIGSTEAIKQTVAAGLGIAIVSRYSAADQLALGTLTAVGVRGLVIRRALTRLTIPGRRPGAPTVAFERMLAEDAGSSD